MRQGLTGLLLAAAAACLAAGAALTGVPSGAALLDATPSGVVRPAEAFAGEAAPAARPGEALALWTPAELAEPASPARAAAERRIRRLPRPDRTPPARLSPLRVPPPLPAAWRGVIRRVRLPEGDRRIALTFDLCERSVHVTGYDARLVDALRAANARATFFAGGKWLRSHPERAEQLMADPRFELGNHSWTHANMLVADPAMRLRQIRWTSAQYELLAEDLDRRLAARGLPELRLPPLTLFRLPYGRGDAATARCINGQGLAVILWDVSGESFGGSPRHCAAAIAAAARPGSIVLLHANCVPKDTAGIVRRLLPLLAAKGYVTATVSELLRAGAPETVKEGYFRSPGDNAVYDTMFREAGTGPRAR